MSLNSNTNIIDAKLPKKNILRSKKTIQLLFDNAENMNTNAKQFPVKIVAHNINVDETPQTLFIVSKRFLKNATDRNRVRRIVKEVFRNNKHSNPHCCLAIMYTANVVLPFNTIEDALLRTIEKINGKIAYTTGKSIPEINITTTTVEL